MKYGVLGSGSANPKVIHDSLLDLISDDPEAVFVIHARRAPQGAVGDVYDFLVDNECKMVSVHRIDDNAPKALLNASVEVVKTEDPAREIIGLSDEILLLWDEQNEDSSNRLASMVDDAGKSIKDLTMALVPIIVEGREDVPAPKAEEPVEETEGFSHEELVGMSIGVLRRHAKAMGYDMPRASKQEIIDAIMNGEAPEVASEVETSSNEMGMIVWYEEGQLRTVHVPMDKISALLS